MNYRSFPAPRRRGRSPPGPGNDREQAPSAAARSIRPLPAVPRDRPAAAATAREARPSKAQGPSSPPRRREVSQLRALLPVPRERLALRAVVPQARQASLPKALLPMLRARRALAPAPLRPAPRRRASPQPELRALPPALLLEPPELSRRKVSLPVPQASRAPQQVEPRGLAPRALPLASPPAARPPLERPEPLRRRQQATAPGCRSCCA